MNSATEAIRAEKLVKTFGSVGEEGGRGAMATPSAPIHRRASGPGTERFVLPGCGAGSAPSRECSVHLVYAEKRALLDRCGQRWFPVAPGSPSRRCHRLSPSIGWSAHSSGVIRKSGRSGGGKECQSRKGVLESCPQNRERPAPPPCCRTGARWRASWRRLPEDAATRRRRKRRT